MAAKVNRSVILYDLKSENQRQLRQALLKIYFQNNFMNAKHLVNLVLVNSSKTNNRMNATNRGKYTNIMEVNQEAAIYDPNFVYDKIEETPAAGANWMEAISLAIQILSEVKKLKVITNQILFLTDLTCSSSSDENLVKIASNLKKDDIYLYIVGPEVLYPISLTSFDRVQEAMQNIGFEGDNSNLMSAKKLTHLGCKVVISDVKRGLQLFFNYKNIAGKQAWNVPLGIGTGISFPVNTLKSLERSKGFTLVPLWKINQESCFASVDDTTKRYQHSDAHGGILKHDKFVPIESTLKFKVDTERDLSVAFVMEISDIPEYILRGPSCWITREDPKYPSKALRCLICRLYEKQCCLIVKRVYSKGNTPIFLAMIPVPSKLWFRGVQLPFSHEFNWTWNNQKLEKTETVESSAVDEFLSGITINSPNDPKGLMTPNLVNTPANDIIVNMVADEILKERIGLSQVDYNPFTGINNDHSQSLRDKWPSRLIIVTEELPVTANSDTENEDDYF